MLRRQHRDHLLAQAGVGADATGIEQDVLLQLGALQATGGNGDLDNVQDHPWASIS